MIQTGDSVGIVCCSNGLGIECAGEIRRLEEALRAIGLQPVLSDYIYATEGEASGTGEERARALMDFYRDDRIKGIFDISGGDLANGILPYLDYDLIADSDKTLWGYSDLTAVLNAVYARTGKASVLYQIRNLLYDHREQQAADFRNTVIDGKDDLFHINYRFLSRDNGCQGASEGSSASDSRNKEAGMDMQGIVVGGNIRCFLKLAGTKYMPDLTDKILLLESYSGTSARIETYLCQLEQMGAFRKAAGILLGTFTQMQQKKSVPSVEKLIRKYAGRNMPIAVTGRIGHGTDAKAIWIGKELES